MSSFVHGFVEEREVMMEKTLKYTTKRQLTQCVSVTDEMSSCLTGADFGTGERLNG